MARFKDNMVWLKAQYPGILGQTVYIYTSVPALLLIEDFYQYNTARSDSWR